MIKSITIHKKDLYKAKLLNTKKLLKKLYLINSLDWLFNSYCNIKRFIKNIIKVIKFMPVVWKFENYDYGYIFKFNYMLHKELYKGLYKQGYHLPKSRHQKALKTIIELYKRLDKKDYDQGIQKYLTRLYGPDEIYFESVANTENKPFGPYSCIRSTREDKMTSEQVKLYNKKINELYKHLEYLKKQDAELLGKLIAKYHPYF